MNLILTPPLAFLIYIPLIIVILMLGRNLVGGTQAFNSDAESGSNYSSGEEAPITQASPGYRPFFLVAFFFAILHLGMLVLGTSTLNITSGIFLVGLILALVALILG